MEDHGNDGQIMELIRWYIIISPNITKDYCGCHRVNRKHTWDRISGYSDTSCGEALHPSRLCSFMDFMGKLVFYVEANIGPI